MESLEFGKHQFLQSLNIQEINHGYLDSNTQQASGKQIGQLNPHSGKIIAKIIEATPEDYEKGLTLSTQAKKAWANQPMPKRGDIIREIGMELRKKKDQLGKLISLEMGKLLSEGLGEVQEAIDMCDYACGLSRTIGGKIIPSERKDHIILEKWNPLGIIGVITAFNFPHAVFCWNACIALVTGNCLVWKGASSTGLVTIATAKIFFEVLNRHNIDNGVLIALVGPGRTVGERMLHDPRVNLISFTGSTKIGRYVSEIVHKRFGRTILELGGNNACIVMEDADVELALKAVFFSAIGTAGQRCTSLRRLYISKKLYKSFKARLLKAYQSIKIGSPLEKETVCGPVHTKSALKEFEEGLQEIKKQGGSILTGGNIIKSDGFYVEPTIVEINAKAEIVKTELFVPILYIFPFDDIEEAIELNNWVPQGLASSMFTKNMQNVFRWIGANGSDCGLVNVNVGTSGAEIGGAFGGEKETGGGRESGSDSWKQYMRRATCTINFGNDLPLSQGIDFEPKLQQINYKILFK